MAARSVLKEGLVLLKKKEMAERDQARRDQAKRDRAGSTLGSLKAAFAKYKELGGNDPRQLAHYAARVAELEQEVQNEQN